MVLTESCALQDDFLRTLQEGCLFCLHLNWLFIDISALQ